MEVWRIDNDTQLRVELRRRNGVEVVGDLMRQSRLRWYKHVEKKNTWTG